jgi:hypothetical protein
VTLNRRRLAAGIGVPSPRAQVVSARASLPARDFARGRKALGFFIALRIGGIHCRAASSGTRDALAT